MENCRFPVDIMMNLLSHLPIKSMVRFRCVCKSWFQLFTAQTSYPYFTQLLASRLNIANPNPILIHLYPHFDRNKLAYKFSFASDYTYIDSPIELEEPDCFTDESIYGMNIYGISKGLVCLKSNNNQSNVIYIWNPITRDNITIPCPPLYEESIITKGLEDYGFGFCEATNEYKVVRIIITPSFRKKYDYQCHANVFTLGTKTWRDRDMEDALLYLHTPDRKSGRIVVNGVVHWLAGQISPYTYTLKIISFDLECEKLQEILLPKDAHDFYSRCLHVEEVSGMLAIMYQNVKQDKQDIRIWVMKDYGVQDSWIKLFTIKKSQIPVHHSKLELFGIANDGNIVMLNRDVLVLFNPETNSARIRKFLCPGGSLPSVYFYMWSLVSPRYITVLKPITESEDTERERKTCS